MATFTDNFDRADNATSLGANWTTHAGTWGILTNQADSKGGSGNEARYSAGASDGGDHYTEARVYDTNVGVSARHRDTGGRYYLAWRGANAIELLRSDDGTFASLGSFTVALTAGDVIRIEAAGSTIKVFYNGVERISATDTNYPGTDAFRRYGGMRAFDVAKNADDWAFGDLGASGVTGTGALTAAPATASGSGALSLTGAGSLVASVATLAAAATVALTGTGSLDAQPASLSGAATVTATGTGSPTAAPAALGGAGALSLTGTGTLTATPAALDGSGTLTLTGTGALTATPATLSGSGNVGSTIAGTGTLTAAPATLTGAGTLALTGTGSLTAAPAALTGTGTVLAPVTGSGDLAASPAILAGTGVIVIDGSGQLTAPAATAGPAVIVAPTPDARTWLVPAETRAWAVPAETRTHVVPAEDRSTRA